MSADSSTIFLLFPSDTDCRPVLVRRSSYQLYWVLSRTPLNCSPSNQSARYHFFWKCPAYLHRRVILVTILHQIKVPANTTDTPNRTTMEVYPYEASMIVDPTSITPVYYVVLMLLKLPLTVGLTHERWF